MKGRRVKMRLEIVALILSGIVFIYETIRLFNLNKSTKKKKITKFIPAEEISVEREIEDELKRVIKQMTWVNENLREIVAKCIINYEIRTNMEIAINEMVNSTIMDELLFIAKEYLNRVLSADISKVK